MEKKNEISVDKVEFDENGEVIGLSMEDLDAMSGGLIVDANTNTGQGCNCAAITSVE